MGIHTSIEWCDSTLNLQMGCDGCELWNPKLEIRRCYAGKLTARNAGNKGWPVVFGQPKIFPERLVKMLKWPDLTGKDRPDKPWLNGYPRVIFLDDMGDTFTESLPLDWLDPFVDPLAASKHILILLTKRPGRAVQFWREWCRVRAEVIPQNFWLLTSVTGPKNMGRIREILKLRALGARVLGVSYEPAWGPVDFSPWTEEGLECPCCGWLGREDQAKRVDEPADDWHFDCPKCGETCAHTPLDELLGAGINWIIAGGESGCGANPSHPDFFRAARDACEAASGAFFFKQWGHWEPVCSLYGDPDRDSKENGRGETFTVSPTGEIVEGRQPPPGSWLMEPVGKKAAGAMLDGREWRQMPEWRKAA